MTKTTFLGYVPSLKSKHEATIVNGRAMKSKGGSIRYLLEGEYDGRKTLPKTVSKADFESVYGFDAKEAESVIIAGSKDGKRSVKAHVIGAKEKDDFIPDTIAPLHKTRIPNEELVENLKALNHADTVGSPSPADVEPPAPSEKPFPQEPSNENFSAEEGGFYQLEVKYNMEDGWEHYGDYDNEEDATSAYYDIYLNHPEVQLLEVDAEGDGDVIYIQRNYDLEVKEALGLFGKKDEKEEEKEESDEPKTQEFTVILQEGDKLELTDIEEEENEEEQAAPDDENTEKEAETLEITDIDWETDDEDVDLPASVLVPSSVVEDEIADYLSDEYGFLVRGYVLNAESEVKATDCDDHFYEAVQAKVTRPVKEDETEDEEESDEEGLSTGAKVALGVGALAAGVALFGAEDDPYENQTDYSRIYEATSGGGFIEHDPIYQDEDRRVEIKYDNPSTRYDWTSPTDVEEDDVEEAVEEELGNEPGTGSYGATLDVRSQTNPDKYVEVDVDMDTDYNEGRYMGMAAEDIEDSDYDDYLDGLEEDALVLYKDNPSHLFEKAYPIDYQVGMNDYESSLLADIQSGYTENSMLFDEDENLTPYGERVLKEMYDSLIDEALGIEWLASKHPPSELLKRGDPIAYRVGLSEYQDAFESESDGYTYAYTKGHEDGMSNDVIYRPSIATDKEKTIYKKILKQKAEDFQKMTPSEFVPFDQMQEELGQMWDETTAPLANAHNYDYEPSNEPSNANFSADNVGNPSPSGPSSTPEPAEATGSEPSNEEFNSENRNLAIGLTAAGVGLVALLGADRIKKLFDRFNL